MAEQEMELGDIFKLGYMDKNLVVSIWECRYQFRVYEKKYMVRVLHLYLLETILNHNK